MKSNVSMGMLRVVDDRQRLLDQRDVQLEQRLLLVRLVELLLALEDRVEPLDGRDQTLLVGAMVFEARSWTWYSSVKGRGLARAGMLSGRPRHILRIQSRPR